MADTNISIDGVLDDDGGKKPGKSRRGKLILFALIGLLVVGAAAGGAFVFFGGDDSAVAAEDEPPVIDVPRQRAYIDLEPFFIQVETGKGVLKNVVVALALEVEQGSDGERQVEQSMPRLYEAYLRTLTDRPLPGAEDGNIEVTHIKNRLRAENLRLLGPGAVHDVVLRNIWVNGQ